MCMYVCICVHVWSLIEIQGKDFKLTKYLIQYGKKQTVHTTHTTTHSIHKIHSTHITQQTVYSTQNAIHSTQHTAHSSQHTTHTTQYTHITQYSQYTAHSVQHSTQHTQRIFQLQLGLPADILFLSSLLLIVLKFSRFQKYQKSFP